MTTATSGVLARFPWLLPVRNSFASYGASAVTRTSDRGHLAEARNQCHRSFGVPIRVSKETFLPLNVHLCGPHVFRFFFQHEFSIFPAGKFGIFRVCFFLKGNQICWVFCEFLLLSGLGAPQDVTAQLFPVLPWDACLRMPSLWQQGKGTKAGGRGRGAPQVYSCVTPFAGAG
jgi:hypothetical protein